jgi:hypothetical protein
MAPEFRPSVTMPRAVGALLLVLGVAGTAIAPTLAMGQGTIETQKGPPPASSPTAPQQRGPELSPQPGPPGLQRGPGVVDDRGQPTPTSRRTILGLRPGVLVALVALGVVVLAVASRRRRPGALPGGFRPAGRDRHS